MLRPALMPMPVRQLRSTAALPSYSAMSLKHDNTFLVIGSDGLLGRQIFSHLSDAGKSVWGTSRRERSADSHVIHLDLAEPSPNLALPAKVHCAFVCAGVTSMEACEVDPVRTRHVNVVNTLRIAEQLLERGSSIQFLSSNAVFDGASAFPDERMPACPTTEYGRQKAEVEARLLEWDRGRGFVGVSRLSKVVAPTVPVMRRFLEGFREGKPVKAFCDLALSPISVDYAVASLLAVARVGRGGIFHFSGERELTYAEFARALANRLGLPASRVTAVASRDRNIVSPYRPAHPALGMAATRTKLAISPQSLDDAINGLLGASTGVSG